MIAGAGERQIVDDHEHVHFRCWGTVSRSSRKRGGNGDGIVMADGDQVMGSILP
jgi:hypothetical protein